MSQYRNGIITSTGAAVSLNLGFVPDRFTIINKTVLDAASATPAVGEAEWINGIVASAKAYITTYTSGAGVVTLLASNGITPVNSGGNWLNTLYTIDTISNANPGIVTVSTIAPTNSMTLVNGMTFTISGVNGLVGLNTNRYVVTGLTIVGGGPTYTFNLYDTFGNPVNTTSSGTFTTSPNAQMDVISYPPTAPVLNATTGQVITPGQPAGNQYDTGFAGVTLGTGVVGASTNILYWEAFLETPTGY